MERIHPFKTLRGRIICYFAIALLPLLAIVLYAYGNFINNEIIHATSRMSMTLETGVQAVDVSISAAQKACISLFYDNRVKGHLKPISESTTEDRIAQIGIHETINSMVAITDAVTENMFLYLDNQHVFSDGLYSFDVFFEKINAFEDYDVAYWKSLLDERIVMKLLPATQLNQNIVSMTQRVIPMVHTTKVAGKRVVAVTTIAVDRIVHALRSGMEGSSMPLTILDGDGGIVFSDFDTALIHKSNEKTGIYGTLSLDNREYQVLYTASEKLGLQYFLAVPTELIHTVTEDYLLVLLASLALCIMAGVLAIFFANKISTPIRHIYSSLDGQENAEPVSLQDVTQKFHFFLSSYLDTHEEEGTLRTGFVEMAVLRLLSGHSVNMAQLTRQLERECDFTDPVFQLCVLEVSFIQHSDSLQDTERMNMQLNFRSDLTNYLTHSLPCLVLEERQDQYICLTNRPEPDEALYDAIAQLMRQLHDNGTVTRLHACVAQGCAMEELPASFAQVLYGLSMQKAAQPFALYWAEKQKPAADVAIFTIKDELQLLSYLRSCDKERVFELIQQMLSDCERVSHEQERLRIHDLFVTGMRFLAEKDRSLSDLNHYRGLRADVDIPGGNAAKRRLLHSFYHELIQGQKNGSENSLTASVMEYVHKHYASDLYLEDIAQGLGLSVKYISKVFKEKNGRNLSEYINEVRIQHVKEMLAETNMSITSISEAAGIYSRSTLMRLFRKYVGVTPSEYRDLVREQKI